MKKTLSLALNQFKIIPESLKQSATGNTPRTELTVNLASLFHHYYLDSFGRTLPNPDPAQFEHLRFLLPTKDFRLMGSGIGVAPGIRRHRSAELGQAFCRLFLHDHLKIVYFAHLHEVLDREAQPAFSPVRVERIHDGDAPDYLCAQSVNQVFLSEAKGRYTPVSFESQEFESWRKQFGRVVVKNSKGQPKKVKGFVVATRFATEQRLAIKSGIFAEDPESPGDEELGREETRELGTLIVALHYGRIAEKLDQPILSAALSNGFVVPEEIRFPATVWRFQFGPLQGVRFVGGYFVPPGGLPAFNVVDGKLVATKDPLRLDAGRGTFFGVEESIFRQVVGLVRGRGLQTRVEPFERVEPFYSAISALRDGSIVGPVEFFVPQEQVVF